jgi:hypothetical protein
LKLLGFEDEATAFVEVDAATSGGAVGVMLGDVEFKRVSLIAGGTGARNLKEIAEFGGTGVGPAGDERVAGGGGHVRRKYEERK